MAKIFNKEDSDTASWRHGVAHWYVQGNLIQGEGSDSLKTALETRGKTAL